MARNDITFLVNLRKNKNTASKTYGSSGLSISSVRSAIVAISFFISL